MKLNAPVTSALPVAFAITSVFLALVMLPGGAAPAFSPGLAPALRVAAGDVAAVVSVPVPVTTSAQPHPTGVVSHPTSVTPTSPRTQPRSSLSVRARSLPAHTPVHHRQVLRTHPALPVTRPAAAPPAPAPSLTKHGKRKALGHLEKLAAKSAAATHAAPSADTSHGRGHPHSHRSDVSHGPPAVPPGHDRGGGQPGEHGGVGVRGGGK